MLYKLAHILRDKLPWLWLLIGVINSLLFMLRYGKKLKDIADLLKVEEGFQMELMTAATCAEMSQWFASQPTEAFDYFRPHGFEEKDLKVLAKDHSFLAFIVRRHDTQEIVGYLMMRCFWWGKCFRGYMVDYRWRGKGINKMMNARATEVGKYLGLNTFGTISPENVASLKSAKAVNDVIILETLPSGDYYVQYLPKS